MTTERQTGVGGRRREPPTTHARGSDRSRGVPPGARGRRAQRPPGLPGALLQRLAAVLVALLVAASVGAGLSVATQDATFGGTVVVSADPAQDGSTLAYALSDLDAASAPEVTFTGAVNTEWDNTTAASNGSVKVGGNLAPNRTTVRVAYARNATPEVHPGSDGVADQYVPNPPATLALACGRGHDPDAGGQPMDWAVYVADGNQTGDSDYTEGTKVGSVSFDESEPGAHCTGISYDATGATNGITISYNDNDAQDDQSSTAWVESARPATGKATVGGTTVSVPHNSTVAVNVTTTGTVDVEAWPTGDQHGGLQRWTVNLTERTETVDPAVNVNGHNLSVTGRLAAGETATRTGDAAWLQPGVNYVNVSLGAVGMDAPAPVVAVEYRHDAASNRTVSYTAETWSERYNVSHDFADATENATVTVPFVGSVVAVRDAESRPAGGEWTAIDPSAIDMDGTTATVHLGDVQANTTYAVRVNGSKAPAVAGGYRVVKPTVLGDQLATEIEVTNATALAIGVGGTVGGERLHYLDNATWDHSERARVTAGGKQVLRLPDAQVGDRATVRTLPLEVRPQSNDVVIEPTDTDGTPEFRVRPGDATGDAVTFRWHRTVTGHKYVLESVSAGAGRDSAVARSPVDLTDDDSDEVLRIYDAGAVEQSSGDNPPGGGGPVSTSGTPLESTPVLLLSSFVGLVGVSYAARRWLSLWQQAVVLGGGGTVVLLVVGERVSSTSVFGPIADGLGRTVPLVVLAGVALVGYVVVKRVGGNSGPTIQIRGRFK